MLALAHQLRSGDALRFERDGGGILACHLVKTSSGREYPTVIALAFRRGHNIPANTRGWGWGWLLRIGAVVDAAIIMRVGQAESGTVGDDDWAVEPRRDLCPLDRVADAAVDELSARGVPTSWG